MKKVYSIYDYLPKEYIDTIRAINNGRLPIGNFLSERKALEEAEGVVNEIDELRNIVREDKETKQVDRETYNVIARNS